MTLYNYANLIIPYNSIALFHHSLSFRVIPNSLSLMGNDDSVLFWFHVSTPIFKWMSWKFYEFMIQFTFFRNWHSLSLEYEKFNFSCKNPTNFEYFLSASRSVVKIIATKLFVDSGMCGNHTNAKIGVNHCYQWNDNISNNDSFVGTYGCFINSW